MLKCEYGCGLVAKFQTKSGKNICHKSPNSCPSNKKKNSESLINSYKENKIKSGKEKYKEISKISKMKMANSNKGNFKADFSLYGKGNHKGYLIFERGYKCEMCLISSWNNKPITLELDHIDGNNRNNVKTNLRLLCPNCHSQTPTWRRSSEKGWKKKKYSDLEIKEAVENSENLNQVLIKLNLRWGSSKTIIDVMSRLNLKYKNSG